MKRLHVPSHWEMLRLGDLLELVYGYTLREHERQDGKNLVFGSNGIIGYHKDARVNGPGIIIGRKGSPGIVTWSDYDFWPIDTTFYVKQKINNDLRWLFYFLIYSRLDYLNITSGVPGLNRNDTYTLVIPVPPVSEQHRIASILSNVDEAIQKTQQIIDQTQRIKRGLMQQLLTKGIGHKKFKDSPIGKIPEEWTIKRIGDITEIWTGGTPSTKKPEYWGGDIPWAASGDVNKKWINDVEGRITTKGMENSNCKLIPINSILIALAGQGKTKATVALLKKELTCNQSLAAIIPSKEFSSLYLLYNLESRYQELRNLAGDSDRAGLNLKLLRDIILPLPPINEQRQIGKIINNVDKKIIQERAYSLQLERIKKGLMQVLLTGKVRVKVNS